MAKSKPGSSPSSQSSPASQPGPSWSPASDKSVGAAALPQTPANLPVRELKPAPEAVAAKAFEMYCERCRTNTPGSSLTDWVMAEAELSRR